MQSLSHVQPLRKFVSGLLVNTPTSHCVCTKEGLAWPGGEASTDSVPAQTIFMTQGCTSACIIK